jgi:hypothetical protein
MLLPVFGALLVALPPASSAAAIVESGYFEGSDFRPLSGARTNVLSQEPAVAFVCSPTAENYELFDKFNGWAQQPHKYAYPAYGVVIIGENQSREVIEEVLLQRQIKIPVFTTRTDYLNENPFLVLILDEGRARQFNGFDPGSLEKELDLLAARAGLEPRTVPTGGETSGSEPRRTEVKNPLFVNRRFEFTVRFPPDWDYKIAKNNDGAVGVPPAGISLDARVWAAPEAVSDDPTDPPPYIQIKEHLKYVGSLAKGEVTVEKKLKVFDNENEGRDYTYSYVRAVSADKPEQKYRGRIQAFVENGVAKVVCVEGSAEEFDRNSEMADKLIYSFRPTIE